MHLGIIETQDFFYTVALNGYFSGRGKFLGVLQILFLIGYMIFVFYFVSKIAEYRLHFVLSSYWNLYDLGLIVLFSSSIYFDVQFMLGISTAINSLSEVDKDIFKDTIPFIRIQIIRDDLQAYLAAAVLLRFLRFLPYFSNLLANLLDVFYTSIRNSIGFLLLFVLIFMSFVFFATLHYGNDLHEASFNQLLGFRMKENRIFPLRTFSFTPLP